jgi:plasmid stabilization system protein ParE
MPRAQWTAKRERQYDHIKSGLKARGKSTDEAEEIASRTVNKVRAQHGEAKQASPASVNDVSPSRRGGLRSHQGAGGRTYRQLYEEARSKGIAGRSKMDKAELEKALKR